jgi:hypothetical protein
MAVCNLEELQNAGVFQVIGESGREGSKKPAMYLIEWNKNSWFRFPSWSSIPWTWSE